MLASKYLYKSGCIFTWIIFYAVVQAIKADDVMFPEIQEILLGGQKSHFQKL